MFSKILIANRGEIAARIVKTCRRLGIATVAVHSDVDADALHVALADEAVRIGPAPAAESYLSIERIVAAARDTGAEAVHPGYGFLAENPEFPRALDAAGIVFIGPPAEAIAAMGDKIEAKRRAAAAGVSTVPGTADAVADVDAAAAAAEDIGYPVMIKASAGGGGKGMRVAGTEAELRDGFARASSEARSSFGDQRVFIEKFIDSPRHVEIQVLADGHGNVVHLGERECSIQRRNQKIVEEAPSPLLDAETRAAMGEQAVALARAVGYASAGTVEFVAGQDKSFYFLEMNTRLQVEHPVTEMITGLDLVEEMIRVAAGETLRHAQADIGLDGWAVEARVYAEDPYRDFLPSIGRLVRYQPPPEGGAPGGATVRIDSGVRAGDEISMYYDPLIAKLVVHGPDRAAAVAGMGRALDAFHIAGIEHNIPFLSALMEHRRWREGRLSTGFIAEAYPDGFRAREPDADAERVIACVAASVDHLSNVRRRAISGQLRREGYAFPEGRVVRFDGREARVAVSGGPPDLTVAFAETGESVAVRSDWTPGRHVWSGTVAGALVDVGIRPTLTGYALAHRGVAVRADVFTEREAELAALMPERAPPDTSKMLPCPMPGLVVSVAVSQGQEVKAGETLAVIEAMKMENVLRAERDAVVARIHVAPGDSLAVDAVIMEFA